MKLKIAKQTIDAERVYSVGVPLVQDNTEHSNHGLVPVQFEVALEPVPAPDSDDDLKPLRAKQRNSEKEKAATRMFPKGTVAKAGDYLVDGVFVDGGFMDLLSESIPDEVSA